MRELAVASSSSKKVKENTKTQLISDLIRFPSAFKLLGISAATNTCAWPQRSVDVLAYG